MNTLKGTVRLVPIGDYSSHRIEWGGMAALANELYQVLKERHNGYCTVEISTPRKPRTTGPKSQSAHFHGHCQQIAKETGHSMQEIKEYVKMECPDWPFVQIGKRMVPKSEADLSTVEEAAAIEVTHRIAAELNITLKEE